MKTFACKDMAPGSDCPFVAEGMNEEEVMGKMTAHMKSEHKSDYEIMSKTSEGDMKGMMKSKIKEK